jgi:hypothetical protein
MVVLDHQATQVTTEEAPDEPTPGASTEEDAAGAPLIRIEEAARSVVALAVPEHRARLLSE